jgi:mannosyltransferase OCH1-like enzyme
MDIPKKIYQAWHDKNPKPVFKKYIENVLQMNPDYDYELFGEEDMFNFVKDNYGGIIFDCYNQLNIITAKVDFWRYLILYKNGGIYIDIDSTFLKPLDELIEGQSAVITREPNPPYEYVQWALFFCKNHPILEKTINNIVHNITNRLFTNNVGRMTGPYPYTLAIDEINNLSDCTIDRTNPQLWSLNPNIKQYPDVQYKYNNYSYRIYGIQYGDFALSWVPEKDTMYSNENPHWTVEQMRKNLLK